MKTYPLRRDDGSLRAFEISSTWLSFRPLYRALRSVEGVRDIHRNYFSDDRITFTFNGEPFVVNEPWGDNSRYWVGPKNAASSTADVTSIHDAFARESSLRQMLFWSK